MTCPTCGEEAFAEDRFCEACGSPLAPAVAAPAVAPEITVPAGPRCTECTDGTIVGAWCDTCGARGPDPRDHHEADLGHVAAVSDVGRRHHRNEDAFAVHDAPAIGVVCDGVSSTVNPELASAAAAQAALDLLMKDSRDLLGAHRAAAEAVINVDAPPHADLGFPSCTFLAGVVDGARVAIGSLGDCRAYWVPTDPAHDGEAVTLDDSWAREAVDGGMDPLVADADPRAHVITRWLGRDADPLWEPRITTRTFDEPGRLILCSDGLWNYVPTPAHLRDLLPDGDPIAQARRLVQFAVDAGGHDNITVVVLDVQPPEPQLAPEEST